MKEKLPDKKVEEEKIEKVKKRETIDSFSVMQKIERNPDNFLTEKSRELVDIFDIPSGAFSGLAVSIEDGKYERISPKLDKLMAKHFTNTRYIVDKLNNIGPISTKDPREKYEGEIDAVIEKTTQDLDNFKKDVAQELADLEKRRTSHDISEKGYEKAKNLLKDALEIYKILIGELKLKKRGFDFLGKKEIVGGDIRWENGVKANMLLEIKYLPGGGFVVLRGYGHFSEWQQNFGDNRNQEIGLANIYKDVQYAVIEGYTERPYGESIKYYWGYILSQDHYGCLMKGLIESGFSGRFLELDSRFKGLVGGIYSRTFDIEDLTLTEAKILFTCLQRYNPQLAKDIGSVEDYRKIFHRQRTDMEKAEGNKELGRIKGGTLYCHTVSVKKDEKGKFLRSLIPTGFELGQMAFSDALSVIKILLMNRAMQNGELEHGIIVDFQGPRHLSHKSYFFDNPGYAMEVVLNNIHELLASHPDVKDKEDILRKLQNLDEETWEWIFKFIGTIPFYKVAEPTEDKDSVEIGDRQRPMIGWTYHATEELSEDNKERLNKVIKNLTVFN